jgi:hypothetical protein
MSARRVVTVVVIALIASAYLAGYWPEYQRRTSLDADVAVLRGQLADAEARVRVGQLLGDLLNISEAVTPRARGTVDARIIVRGRSADRDRSLCAEPACRLCRCRVDDARA